MKTVLVGIPILKDARRFHFLKGRRWTVFEHMVLEAVARKDATVSELVVASDLPRRVIIEILVRLMRAGWVQLHIGVGPVQFGATTIGRAHSTRAELPPVTSPEARYLAFTVELIRGGIFRTRDLVPVTDEQWRRRTAGRRAALMVASDLAYSTIPDAHILAETLLDSDEELTRVDTHDWRPSKRIGIVSVRGDDIEGLGAKPSIGLRDEILSAARKAEAVQSIATISVAPRVAEFSRERPARSIHFRLDDLVLGGEAHRATLSQVIARARHRVILHSTFISPDKGKEIIDLLKGPVKRGAHIDILWGQTADKVELNDTRNAAIALRDHLQAQGLSDRIRLHMTSTRSHAKLILADTGDLGAFTAIVGSCNWMSSDLTSFDASVRLREANIVADVAFELSELTRTRDGQIPDLAAELVRIGMQLEKMNARSQDSRCVARIIKGSEHAQALLDARDQANKNILILSHRLGPNARPSLKPLAAASRAKGISPEAFYGRLTGKATSTAVVEEILKGREDGLEVRAVLKPRLHAKVLAWDDDDAVITSQNWLSADPSDVSGQQEIGIRIHSPGIGRAIVEQFRIAREFAV